MDLWDVVKLMVRRWYVAGPMLLVTVAAALWTVSTVKPDYEATTNVTLLPPSLRNDGQAGKEQKVNPWDTESLTIATITYLNSKRLHDQMAADGYSSVWEAETHIQFPSLIIIKVTAPGADKAQSSARRLQELVTTEVERQQSKYNLKPGEEITTIPFDNGDNLETTSSKTKRALIVVVGVGIIFTLAFTVGLDALLRWRAGRRMARGVAVPAQRRISSAQQPPASPDGPGAQTRSLPVPQVGPVQSPPISNPIAVRVISTTTSSSGRPAANGGRGSDETQVMSMGVGYKSANAAGEDVKPSPSATPADAGEPQPEVAAAERPQVPVHEDATIVLPMTNAPWANKAKRDGRTTENGKR